MVKVRGATKRLMVVTPATIADGGKRTGHVAAGTLRPRVAAHTTGTGRVLAERSGGAEGGSQSAVRGADERPGHDWEDRYLAQRSPPSVGGPGNATDRTSPAAPAIR